MKKAIRSQLYNDSYAGFISYSHADNVHQGRKWASWLHQAIETYQVPKELVGSINQNNEVIPSHIYPIFLDEQELPVDDDLADAITQALDDSQILIIICSPRAAKSTYVTREIDYFKKIGKSKRILSVVVDGEPNTSWDKNKLLLGFDESDECLPLPLCTKYDETGTPTSSKIEPIAADFRVFKEGRKVEGWTSPEAYRKFLSQSINLSSKEVIREVNEYEKQQHLMLLKIIAGILRIPTRELTQRDKQYQLELEKEKAKRLRKWIGSISIIAVIAIASSITASVFFRIAGHNEELAKSQRDAALSTQSLFLSDLAKQQVINKNFDTALLLSLNSLPGIYGGKRPIINSSQTRLAMVASKQNKVLEVKHDVGVLQAKFNFDIRYFFTRTKNNEITVWSVSNGEKIASKKLNEEIEDAKFSGYDDFILVKMKNKVLVWSFMSESETVVLDTRNSIKNSSYSKKENKLIVLESRNTSEDPTIYQDNEDRNSDCACLGFNHSEYSPDGKIYATAAANGKIKLWSVNSKKKLGQMVHENSVQHFTFSPDGKYLVSASEDETLSIWSMRTHELVQSFRHNGEVNYADISFDGNFVLSASEDRTASVWQTGFRQSHTAFHPEKNSIKTSLIDGDDRFLTMTYDDDTSFFKIKNFNEQTPVKIISRKGRFEGYHFNEHANYVVMNDNNKSEFVDIDSGKKFLTANFWRLESDIFSADGGRLNYRRGSVYKIFDIEESKEIASFTSDRAPKFFMGGKYFLTTNNNILHVWSVESGSLVATYKSNGKTSPINIVFNPFSSIIAIAYFRSRYVHLIDGLKGENLTTIEVKSGTSGAVVDGSWINLVISPDNKYLLTESLGYPDFLELWSINTGEKIRSIKGGTGEDRYNLLAAFSKDEKYLATMLSSYSIEVSNISSGEQIYTLHDDEKIEDFRFHSNGKDLITLNKKQILKSWTFLPQGLKVDEAIKKLPINRTCLTPDERKKYFLSDLTDEQWVERGCPQYVSNENQIKDE